MEVFLLYIPSIFTFDTDGAGFDTEFQNGNPPEGFKIRGTDGALIEDRLKLGRGERWGLPIYGQEWFIMFTKVNNDNV